MKIKQKREFKPITITLETEQEVVAMWDVILSDKNERGPITREFARNLSDWFSTCGQISGVEFAK